MSYQDECKRRCELCAAEEVFLSPGYHLTRKPDPIRCTAPTKAEYIRELEAKLAAAEAVISASRCIKHWHDTNDGGIIVSGQHVVQLWDALEKFDAALKDSAK